MTSEAARAVILLVEAAVRGAVVAGLVGGVLAMARVRSAAIRSSMWTFVLYASLAMPALTLVLPAWRVPVPVGFEPAPAPLTAVAPSPGIAALRPVSTGVVSVAAPVSAPRPTRPGISLVLLLIELTGCLAFACWACFGLLATRRLVRHARAVNPVDDLAMHDRLGRHAHRLGVRRLPSLLETADAVVPMTVGVLAPAIVLPRVWRAWPEAELDAVLAHELAHIARGDARTQRLALVYRGVFWWHPLAWWLNRQMQDLAEQASDVAALATGIEPAAYAETLLGFFARASGARGRAAWHVAMARGSVARAERRLARILAWSGGTAMKRSKWFLLNSAVAVATVAVVTASARPVAAPFFDGMPVPSAPLAVPVSSSLQPDAVPVTLGSARRPGGHQTVLAGPAARPAPSAVLIDAVRDPHAPAHVVSATIKDGKGVSVVVQNDSSKEISALLIFSVRNYDHGGSPSFEGRGGPLATALPSGERRAIDFAGGEESLNGSGAEWRVLYAVASVTFADGSRWVSDQAAMTGLVERVSQQSDGSTPFGQGAFHPGDDGVTPPQVVKKAEALYTAAAMRAKIQGTAVIEVVVQTDGTVGQTRVAKSLDATYGLDDEAVAAARKWIFTPGTKDGQSVPVICEIEIEFRLH